MSILVNRETRVLVQGFTGKEGTFHAQQMIAYGTNVVGGVVPGKGGQTHLDRPVFHTVADGVKETGADASVIFVPPAYAAEAVMEAADAGVAVVVTPSVHEHGRAATLARAGVDEGHRLLAGNRPGAQFGRQVAVVAVGGDLAAIHLERRELRPHLAQPVRRDHCHRRDRDRALPLQPQRRRDGCGQGGSRGQVERPVPERR